MGKPSLGSWVGYGLGTENQNLPAFVVLPDPGGGIKGGPPAYGSGFLPTSYQGTVARSGDNPILNLRPPASLSPREQRRTLDLIGKLNARHLDRRGDDNELAARIQAYELAYRMQSAAPEAVDFTRETRETKHLYGLDDAATVEFGRRCLLARRLVDAAPGSCNSTRETSAVGTRMRMSKRIIRPCAVASIGRSRAS